MTARAALTRGLALSFAGLALCFAFVGSAAADGFIVIERPPEPLRRSVRRPHFPLSVKHHHVSVKINGVVAVTEVDQVFHNPNPVQLEGTYIFPLPEDAAVTKFSMFVDGRELEGEILERKKAKAIYEGIVRRMEDPALLEYMGRGLFKCRVFPIPANGDKRIKLTYSQTLKRDSGRMAYSYPLNTEKFSSAPLSEAKISVAIHSKLPIKSLFSPSHSAVAVKRTDETAAQLNWSARNTLPDKDFKVLWDVSEKDVGLSIWTYKKPAKDGYFLVTISPKREHKESELAAKDVVFVLDTSGSMRGDFTDPRKYDPNAPTPMDQARRALAYCVNSLGKSDRFNVVTFSSEARPMRRGLIEASAENRAAMVGAIMDKEELRARGGTNPNEALLAALAMRPKDSSEARPFMVVFITDGEATIGEVEPETIKKNVLAAAHGTRIFTLGVGVDLDPKLLDSIAAATGGEQEYVLPSENLEVKLSRFFDKISYPVLSNCELAFEGIWVKEVFPKKPGDLFKGRTLNVVGRYKGQGPIKIRLRGTAAGKPVEYVLEGKVGAESTELDFLPGRWASQKIGFLLDQIRLNGEHPELKGEVIWLAKTYGLPTPYTSALVVEDSPPVRRARPGQGARPGWDTERNRPVPGGGDGRGAADPKAPSAAAEPEESAADSAFQELHRKRESARKQAQGGARANALEAKEKEVRRSMRIKGLKSGKADALDELDTDEVKKVMRKIGAKTFYRKGDTWFDSSVDAKAKPARTIKAFSDEYFELVKAKPELGRFLTLGKSLVIEFEGEVLKFTD